MLLSESPLEAGEKAPEFSLPNREGKTVSLKDFAGKWLVLYFYPRDNTPGCTREACEFTAHLDDFAALGATVVGVSPDSPDSHQKFTDKHQLGVELLSDSNHEVLPQYFAWGEKKMYGKTTKGVVRSTVLIDPEGRIAWHWPKVSVPGHVLKVRQKIEDLAAD